MLLGVNAQLWSYSVKQWTEEICERKKIVQDSVW
jgi:hypothetical protein